MNSFCFRVIVFFLYSVILLGIPTTVFSQSTSSHVFSEAPIIFEDGERMSTQVTIKFNEKVLNLPPGIFQSSHTSINPGFTSLKNHLNSLQQRFGSFTLIKQVPSAEWGDTLRVNNRTGHLVKIPDFSQIYALRFNGFVPIDSIIWELSQLEVVEYCHQPIQTVSIGDPNDPCYSDIGDCINGLTGNQWNLYKINASQAWDITTGSSNIVVGILENGGIADKDHLDFLDENNNSQFVSGYGNAHPETGHASMVAGIVGAATNDGDGVASLGWNIKMIPYAYFNYSSDPNNQGGLLNRINTAVANGVKVINCSFVTVNQNNTRSCIEPYSEEAPCQIFESANYPSVSQAISAAIAQNVVIVAGYGNTGWEITNQHPDCEDCLPISYTPYPASYSGVIGVTATDINDNFGESTTGVTYNSGTHVDVSAPGVDIVSTSLNDNYSKERGTSFAAPHVAALAALILSLDPDLSPSQVADIIQTTAVDLGSAGRDNLFGHGRIDAFKALAKVLPPTAPQNLTPSIVNQANNPRLDWDENTDGDFAEYRVWKKKGSGSWNVINTVTNVSTTSYIDYSETGVDFAQYANNVEIKYKVVTVDVADLLSDDSDIVVFNQEGGGLEKTAGTDDVGQSLAAFSIVSVYPNPFNPTTTVRFQVSHNAQVKITVYNVLGEQVITLSDRYYSEGVHNITWDGRSSSGQQVESGTYFLRMLSKSNEQEHVDIRQISMLK